MTPTAAANLYAAMAKAVQPQGEPAKPVAQGDDFASFLKTTMSEFTESGQATEQAAMAAAAGKTDVVDVVTAVAETELALETLVSVRDRVIEAYQEVMRMPI